MDFELTNIKYMKSIANKWNTLYLYKLIEVENIGGVPCIIYKQWSLSSTEGSCQLLKGTRHDGCQASILSNFIKGAWGLLEEITEHEFMVWNII